MSKIQSVAIVLAGIQEYLDSCTVEELRAMLDECKQTTTTNCWCYTYRAAQYLMPLLEREIVMRG